MTSYTSKTISGGTANPAVATDRYWQPISTCPVGKKVNLLTVHGVAIVPGTISERTRKDYMGWEPLARIPCEWKL